MKCIKYVLVILLMLLNYSCKKNSIRFSIDNSEKRTERKEKIRNNLDYYIKQNYNKDIIRAYFYIIENQQKCVVNQDNNFFVGFNKDSLKLGMSEKYFQLSPLPISYKIKDRDKYLYKIYDVSDNRLKSFILNFEFNAKKEIEKLHLFLSYYNEQNELLKREISIDENFDFMNEWKFK